MDAASWKQLGHHNGQCSSLEAAKRNQLRVGKRANRLTEGIVLILIAAMAIGLLVSATLALVELN